MAFLTNISGIPLYSTISEALKYGFDNNLNGYHVHRYKKQVGYMAGYTHALAVSETYNIYADVNSESQRTIVNEKNAINKISPITQSLKSPVTPVQPTQIKDTVQTPATQQQVQVSQTNQTSYSTSSGGGGY